MFFEKEAGEAINGWISNALILAKNVTDARREQRDRHHKEKMILELTKWRYEKDSRLRSSGEARDAIYAAKEAYRLIK